MTRDVQAVPPASRQVRWGAVLSYRWPLAAVGLGLSVYGGLIALMLFYVQSGRPGDDALLDAGPVGTAEARIVRTSEPPRRDHDVDGVAAELVEYSFDLGSGEHVGRSLAPVGHVAGESAPVEFLPEQPGVNRLVGSRMFLLPDLVAPVLGLAVFPGLLALLMWLRGVFELRRMLARGDVSAAEPIRVEKIRWVIPEMLRTDYRFRDHRARWREGHHWVRAHSELGNRLMVDPGPVAVVHDRAHPELSRLVLPEDFGSGSVRRSPRQALPRA